MKFWMNLSVKTKLIGAFGLLILMIVAVSGAALLSIKPDGDQFTGYVQGAEARAAAANQVRLAVDRRAIAARNLVLVTKPEDSALEKAAVLAAVVSIGRVTTIVGEIRTASAEQSEGVGQVGGAVSSMDRTTQQNAALVEEMAADASSLKSQAMDLVRAVGMFKLSH